MEIHEQFTLYFVMEFWSVNFFKFQMGIIREALCLGRKLWGKMCLKKINLGKSGAKNGSFHLKKNEVVLRKCEPKKVDI